MKAFHLSFLLIACMSGTSAQINLECNGRDKHSLYLNVESGAGGFYRIDNVDSNPSDTIYLSPKSSKVDGISINRNIFTNTADMAMFGAIGPSGTYYYWDGTQWIDTHHAHGESGINIGGTSSYIFNLAGGDGKIFRYNGTGHATLLVSNLPTVNKAVYDIAADKAGNFYVFFTSTAKIVCYNPDGIPMDTFTTSGNPGSIQPGFAILGDKMYIVDNSPGIYEGIQSNNHITFTKIKDLGNISVTDIAACPDAGEPLAVFKNPEAPHLAIYPNPADNFALIKLHNTNTIEITDMLGRKIITETVKGKTEHHLVTEGWAKGTYCITATTANGQKAISKLIIE